MFLHHVYHVSWEDTGYTLDRTWSLITVLLMLTDMNNSQPLKKINKSNLHVFGIRGKNCPMGKSGQADITHYSINPLKWIQTKRNGLVFWTLETSEFHLFSSKMSLFNKEKTWFVLPRLFVKLCVNCWGICQPKLCFCLIFFLKASLERAKFCLLLCSPHVTWICSPLSSPCITHAWR